MMIPGVAVAMGGRDWLVPPLTLGELRRLMPKVRQLTEIGVRRDKAALSSGCKAHPAIRSGRKQSEQSWR
jgi:hypothetical protein